MKNHIYKPYRKISNFLKGVETNPLIGEKVLEYVKQGFNQYDEVKGNVLARKNVKINRLQNI